ncbi:MAG TPA: circularly permuted type 2 ATP-grasp protein [Methylomirabilota bacterium]|nr:circularly permuted type 2 ATP-grasp protein [Methylomirabilota bacterium]
MNEVAAEPTIPGRDVFADYRAADSVFDESQSADGALRPHYTGLQCALAHLGPDELKRRADTCRRLVDEQGITYNIYGDPRGAERPWQLDPLPLLIAPQEWSALENALIQRATLINRILADCYGPQELIRSKWLPPALVFAQPDFLRPCHGIELSRKAFLHFYACDLARSADGRWWVVSDRTQIPTGAGYALANRLITSRIFPEAFRDCHVQRLAGFFRAVQHALASLGKRRTDNPRIVLLTPGPYNETYFEQTYLARYLGYSLVEGQDLTVRDDRVFLKTLSGLEPVDVILRRVDDDFCDPLELRNDSMLGVPGLVEALRAGNVAVANALGSGLLQSPAFLAFLPGLCRHILGEELKLPSVASWWCGQKDAERYVLEHLDDLFIKAAFSRRRITNPDRAMSAAEREALKKRIEFQPHLFAAQERIELSTAPCITSEGVAPRRVSLRVYVVASNGSYKVMPGGLTRVAPDRDSRSVSMQRGGASKDTWVLSEKPVDETSLLESSGHAIELRRVGNNLPSRMADSFFWLGRYAERADATSRLLRSALIRFSPENTGDAMPVLGPLLSTLESQGVLSASKELATRRQNPEALEAELIGAIFDPSRPGSLRAIGEKLQRLATLARERTSGDLWRVLTQLDDWLTKPGGSLVMLSGDALDVLNQVLLNIAALHGLARENMTRAQGWRFLDIGCRIERSLQLCSLLDAALSSDQSENPSVLEAVLEVCDSTITYRSRYNLLPHIAAVLDLVLLDDTNPRSLLFQLNQLVKHFVRLPQEQQSALPTPSQRALLECLTRVRLLDPREIRVKDGSARDNAVHAAIRDTLRDLPRISEAIAVSYFAHSSISRAGGSK